MKVMTWILALVLCAGAMADDQCVICIDAKGCLFLGDKQVESLKTITDALGKRTLAQRRALTVVVRADDRAAYRTVRRVIDALRALEITRVLFGRLVPKKSDQLAELDAKLKKDPFNVKFHFDRSTMLYDRGKLAAAEADMKRVVELDPKLQRGWLQLARINLRLGKLEEAMVSLNRAIMLAPNNPDAFVLRGRIQLARKDLAGAVADLDRAIALSPNLARAYYSRGRAISGLGRYEQALKDFERAIELDPKYAEAYRERGKAKRKLGQLADAIADFEAALRLDPGLSAGLRKQLRTSAPKSKLPRTLQIRLDASDGGVVGTLLVEQRFRDAGALAKLLEGQAKDREVVIDAGKDVPFKHVVEILRVLRKANVERITFATRRAAPEKVSGVVIQVASDVGLVIVDVDVSGQGADGLRAGAKLTISRGNKFIGSVVVRSQTRGLVVARIDRATTPAEIKVGDRVSLMR